MVKNFSLIDVQLINQITDVSWTKGQKHENSYGNKVIGDSTSNENIGDELLEEDLLQFLRANFHKSENFDEVILFLSEYSNLIDIIYLIPNLFNMEFPNDSLELRISSRMYEENKLFVLVHTKMDGFDACKKIEKIEDMLYDDFGNGISNLLFSAEFLK